MAAFPEVPVLDPFAFGIQVAGDHLPVALVACGKHYYLEQLRKLSEALLGVRADINAQFDVLSRRKDEREKHIAWHLRLLVAVD